MSVVDVLRLGLDAASGTYLGRFSAYRSPDETEGMPSMRLRLLDSPLPTCINDVSAVSDHALVSNVAPRDLGDPKGCT